MENDLEDIISKARGEDVRDALVDALGLVAASTLPEPGEEGDVLTVDANGAWGAMEWT